MRNQRTDENPLQADKIKEGKRRAQKENERTRNTKDETRWQLDDSELRDTAFT